MAVKKSEIYRSLWAICDQLWDSMNASQYWDIAIRQNFRWAEQRIGVEEFERLKALEEIDRSASSVRPNVQ